MMTPTKTARDLLKLVADKKNFHKHDIREHSLEIARICEQSVNTWAPTLKDKKRDTPIKVLDFFCGCGGMSLGFAALGQATNLVEIIGGCDLNKDALSTFEHNFSAPGVCANVAELALDDGALNDFLRKIPKFKNQGPLVVIGCAPCQGFSSHRKKQWSKEDQRNTLPGAFATMAIKLNPDCIIMENVPEMLSKKYWKHFLEVRESLETAGYYLMQNIYNAAAFGVPQERFRAVLIAMKKPFLLPNPQLLRSDQYRTVRDAIGDLPIIKPGIASQKDELHRCAAHRRETIETIKAVPKNGGSRPIGVGPKCLDKVNGFSDVYGRLSWDKPSITITHYARNPASGRFVHPQQNRGLSAREAARLQSFPDGFEFKGTFDSIFKQIGEAVPPLLSAGIAAHTIVEMLSKPATKDELNSGLKSISDPVSSSYSSVIAGIKRNGRAA
jgi:DNA (cytosine-5)-methyltransferase 1